MNHLKYDPVDSMYLLFFVICTAMVQPHYNMVLNLLHFILFILSGYVPK